jgi:hypothetical protein
MEARPHETREAWLNYLATRMMPIFQQLAAPLPARLRIAIGFTSSGQRSKRIGECWDNRCSEDGYFEIFIRPDLGESKELLPMQVAAILGHELIHAAVGIAAGHGREFRRVAKGIGLVGSMAATTAGPEFELAMQPILQAAGPLPHGRLRLTAGANSHSGKRKPQNSRQIKCTCADCGYSVHTTGKWLALAGAPLCPNHGRMEIKKTKVPAIV